MVLACTAHAEQDALSPVPDQRKPQMIETTDRFGTIEEQRVQAMYSEIHYRSASGGAGYQLVGADGESASIKSAHSDSDELMIPSWNLFSW